MTPRLFRIRPNSFPKVISPLIDFSGRSPILGKIASPFFILIFAKSSMLGDRKAVEAKALNCHLFFELNVNPVPQVTSLFLIDIPGLTYVSGQLIRVKSVLSYRANKLTAEYRTPELKLIVESLFFQCRLAYPAYEVMVLKSLG